MKRFHFLLLPFALLTFAACHPGPVVGKGSGKLPVGGTIAGIVSTDGNTAVVGRKVTAINTGTGTRYDVTTGKNDFDLAIELDMYAVRIEDGEIQVAVS